MLTADTIALTDVSLQHPCAAVIWLIPLMKWVLLLNANIYLPMCVRNLLLPVKGRNIKLPFLTITTGISDMAVVYVHS